MNISYDEQFGAAILSGPGRGRQEGRRMADDRGDSPGVYRFAVGRTVFWEPLVGLRDKKTTREEAVAEIARRYRSFVDVFEKARAS